MIVLTRSGSSERSTLMGEVIRFVTPYCKSSRDTDGLSGINACGLYKNLLVARNGKSIQVEARKSQLICLSIS